MKPGWLRVSLTLVVVSWISILVAGCADRINNLADDSRASHLLISDDLKEIGLRDEYVKRIFYTEHTCSNVQWISLYAEYTVPASFDWEYMLANAGKTMPEAYTVEVNRIMTAPPVNVARLIFIKDQLPLATIEVTQQVNAKMAIIIDDVGNNNKALNEALMIQQPITYAVLPQLAYSKKLADLFAKRGDLIILHQPMASVKGNDPGPGAITMDMTDQQMLSLLDENFSSIPYARGVNNHMGSAITADENKMRLILSQLQGKDMFFLDSVTGETVCGRIASEIGYPIYKRDVFLDNEHEKQYIYGQISQLMDIALERGWSIGIGHFHPITMQCIYEMLPEMDKKGIKLVYLNELPR